MDSQYFKIEIQLFLPGIGLNKKNFKDISKISKLTEDDIQKHLDSLASDNIFCLSLLNTKYNPVITKNGRTSNGYNNVPIDVLLINGIEYWSYTYCINVIRDKDNFESTIDENLFKQIRKEHLDARELIPKGKKRQKRFYVRATDVIDFVEENLFDFEIKSNIFKPVRKEIYKEENFYKSPKKKKPLCFDEEFLAQAMAQTMSTKNKKMVVVQRDDKYYVQDSLYSEEKRIMQNIVLAIQEKLSQDISDTPIAEREIYRNNLIEILKKQEHCHKEDELNNDYFLKGGGRYHFFSLRTLMYFSDIQGLIEAEDDHITKLNGLADDYSKRFLTTNNNNDIELLPAISIEAELGTRQGNAPKGKFDTGYLKIDVINNSSADNMLNHAISRRIRKIIEHDSNLHICSTKHDIACLRLQPSTSIVSNFDKVSLNYTIGEYQEINVK